MIDSVYTFDEIYWIQKQLMHAQMLSHSLPSDNFQQGFTLYDTVADIRVRVGFTDWRSIYNSFVDIGYVVIVLTNQPGKEKDRTADHGYYYITCGRSQAAPEKVTDRLSLPAVVKQIQEFIEDFKKPLAERKYIAPVYDDEYGVGAMEDALDQVQPKFLPGREKKRVAACGECGGSPDNWLGGLPSPNGHWVLCNKCRDEGK